MSVSCDIASGTSPARWLQSPENPDAFKGSRCMVKSPRNIQRIKGGQRGGQEEGGDKPPRLDAHKLIDAQYRPPTALKARAEERRSEEHTSELQSIMSRSYA